MSILAIIIVLVVLGMLVYPVLQIIPNEAQKRQVAFRQAATRHGLHIQVRHPVLPAELGNRYPDIIRCTGYSKPSASRLRQAFVALRSQAGDWIWINDSQPPSALLATLQDAYRTVPPYCLAIEQSGAGTTLFLIDSRPVEDLPAVEKSLDTLNRLIAE